ncbi:sugar ABC transporter permease [Kaistia dalseonensis]|uniref:Multiple sugar transport system permease protein n=1 Tax=Kaistia dalseonensis TaxID=410840 RepID=A0ABU0H522_9HYPH|nr:sugar ABC transporter permease [Kaistia dalseonensis]MCX5494828.1 sugar ABC transporter permease [Kaistia dalseonensis]MDQ0437409.1 multiple sugar transport system permease protein [Kaistia dalseonensis]
MKLGRNQATAAFILVAPFVIAYLVLFIYPTYKMVQLSFTDAPLIGEGNWIGWANYIKLASDKQFFAAALHTGYFVLLTVIPTTLLGLVIALMVTRLKGWLQSLVLAAFFLPYILPVTVVFLIWQWMLDLQFGIAQYAIELFNGSRVAVFRDKYWAMPSVAFITIWWTNGFNVLLFIAGLRNISQDLYDAASLDNASSWQQFRHLTWPLIWPVTALVLTIQLILQLKIFDQIYLFTQGGPFNSTYVMVQYIYKFAFQLNRGGYAAAVAVILFLVIVVVSVLQYQVLRVRGARS